MSRTADNEESKTEPGWAQARNQLFQMIMDGRSFSGRERNCCFLNTGQNSFATVSAVTGLNFADDGRCIAVTDWDQDGDLDFWTSNRTAPRLRLMRNDTPTQNRSVAFRLVGNGTTTNRDAIGARVELFLTEANDSTTPIKRVHTIRAGEGFLSQSSKWVHFGVPHNEVIDHVVVHWPGGKRQVFEEVIAGERYELPQDQAAVHLTPRSDADGIAAGDSPSARTEEGSRIALLSRVPMPDIQYDRPDGTTQVERFDQGIPTLVNLWATWCAPCVNELGTFASEASQVEGRIRILAVSIDAASEDAPTPTEIEQFLKQLSFPHAWGIGDVEQISRLQELHQQFFFQTQSIPLPSSFLVDADGRLSVVYHGPVSLETVLQDIESLSDSADRAACLPGRYLQHDRAKNATWQADVALRYRLAAWLEETGKADDAIAHFAALSQLDPSWPLPHRHMAKLYLTQMKIDEAGQSAAKALELDPNNARAHNTMGNIWSRRGDERTAASHYQKAIQADDQFAEAFNNLGTSLASMGRLDVAANCFQRAIDIDSEFSEALTNLGKIYAHQNKANLAVQHFQRAVQIDPTNADAFNNLGTMFARGGQFEKAVEYFQEALRLDPDNREIKLNYQRAEQLLKQPR